MAGPTNGKAENKDKNRLYPISFNLFAAKYAHMEYKIAGKVVVNTFKINCTISILSRFCPTTLAAICNMRPSKIYNRHLVWKSFLKMVFPLVKNTIGNIEKTIDTSGITIRKERKVVYKICSTKHPN